MKKAAKGYETPKKPKSKFGSGSPGNTPRSATSAVTPDGSSAARRQLCRRESEEQTQRIMSRKLSHIPKEILDTQENSKGQKAADFILAEVRVKKSLAKKGRLSTKFWFGFWESFDFGSVIGDLLPDNPPDEEVDTYLLDAILQARAENPAERKIEPILRWMEKAKSINQTSLFGVLVAMQEGPCLIHSHAEKIRVGVAELVGRLPPFRNG